MPSFVNILFVCGAVELDADGDGIVLEFVSLVRAFFFSAIRRRSSFFFSSMLDEDAILAVVAFSHNAKQARVTNSRAGTDTHSARNGIAEEVL